MKRFTIFEVAAAVLLVIGILLTCLPTAAGGDSVLFPVCHNGESLLVATEAIQAGHISHGDYLSCEGRCCYSIDGLYVAGNMVEADCALIAGSRYFPNPNSPCFQGGD